MMGGCLHHLTTEERGQLERGSSESQGDRWFVHVDDHEVARARRSWTGNELYDVKLERLSESHDVAEAWPNRDTKQGADPYLEGAVARPARAARASEPGSVQQAERLEGFLERQSVSNAGQSRRKAGRHEPVASRGAPDHQHTTPEPVHETFGGHGSAVSPDMALATQTTVGNQALLRMLSQGAAIQRWPFKNKKEAPAAGDGKKTAQVLAAEVQSRLHDGRGIPESVRVLANETRAGSQETTAGPSKDTKAPAAETLPDLAASLEATSKAEGSALYKNVVDALDTVNMILKLRVASWEFNRVQTAAIEHYNLLLDSCRKYLASPKESRLRGFFRSSTETARRQARRDLVEQINTLAQRDLRALYDIHANREAGRHGITLLELISSESRTVKKTPSQVTTTGAGTSIRYRFNEDGKTFFFTKQETLKSAEDAQLAVIDSIQNPIAKTAFGEMYKDSSVRLNISSDSWKARDDPAFLENANKQLKGENKPGYNSMADFIRGEYGKDGKTRDLSGFYDFSTDESCKRFCDICIMLTRAESGANIAAGTAQIEVGSNISSRNAAMSRLADLLGIGDLLARSVTAEVALPENLGGGKVKGNLMEKAQGQAIEDEKLRNSDVSSGELQRQLVCLQVLDTLCGQIDRHFGNYFIIAERNEQGALKITGVQGIDNDMAFGNIRELSDRQELPRFVDAKGNPALPVVDRRLAERLLAVTPEMVEFAVADIIKSQVELSALTSRLKLIQAVLPQMTLLERQDWGEASRNALLKGAQTGMWAHLAPNYYARLHGTQGYLVEQKARAAEAAFKPYAGRGSDPDAMMDLADSLPSKVKLEELLALDEAAKARILALVRGDAKTLNIALGVAYRDPSAEIFSAAPKNQPEANLAAS